eukprot:TRINITY_DN20094_c0_g1_i1.p1 TRINITY_DN20094_c0_g1~~TRINITY_DN20094_c0_g1_i1.p1  ORF type:complete len:1066 (+),score=142.36 TRINITY_DN20094_c0_g1_i1:164-3199(+)
MYRCDPVGRRMRSSKLRHAWVLLAGQPGETKIELLHSRLSGKKQVLVHGTVAYSTKEARFQWSYEIQPSGTRVTLVSDNGTHQLLCEEGVVSYAMSPWKQVETLENSAFTASLPSTEVPDLRCARKMSGGKCEEDSIDNSRAEELYLDVPWPLMLRAAAAVSVPSPEAPAAPSLRAAATETPKATSPARVFVDLAPPAWQDGERSPPPPPLPWEEESQAKEDLALSSRCTGEESSAERQTPHRSRARATRRSSSRNGSGGATRAKTPPASLARETNTPTTKRQRAATMPRSAPASRVSGRNLTKADACDDMRVASARAAKALENAANDSTGGFQPSSERALCERGDTVGHGRSASRELLTSSPQLDAQQSKDCQATQLCSELSEVFNESALIGCATTLQASPARACSSRTVPAKVKAAPPPPKSLPAKSRKIKPLPPPPPVPLSSKENILLENDRVNELVGVHDTDERKAKSSTPELPFCALESTATAVGRSDEMVADFPGECDDENVIGSVSMNDSVQEQNHFRVHAGEHKAEQTFEASSDAREEDTARLEAMIGIRDAQIAALRWELRRRDEASLPPNANAFTVAAAPSSPPHHCGEQASDAPVVPSCQHDDSLEELASTTATATTRATATPTPPKAAPVLSPPVSVGGASASTALPTARCGPPARPSVFPPGPIAKPGSLAYASEAPEVPDGASAGADVCDDAQVTMSLIHAAVETPAWSPSAHAPQVPSVDLGSDAREGDGEAEEEHAWEKHEELDVTHRRVTLATEDVRTPEAHAWERFEDLDVTHRRAPMLDDVNSWVSPSPRALNFGDQPSGTSPCSARTAQTGRRECRASQGASLIVEVPVEVLSSSNVVAAPLAVAAGSSALRGIGVAPRDGPCLVGGPQVGLAAFGGCSAAGHIASAAAGPRPQSRAVSTPPVLLGDRGSHPQRRVPAAAPRDHFPLTPRSAARPALAPPSQIGVPLQPLVSGVLPPPFVPSLLQPPTWAPTALASGSAALRTPRLGQQYW